MVRSSESGWSTVPFIDSLEEFAEASDPPPNTDPPNPRMECTSVVRIHFIIVRIRWTGLAPWELTSVVRSSESGWATVPFIDSLEECLRLIDFCIQDSKTFARNLRLIDFCIGRTSVVRSSESGWATVPFIDSLEPCGAPCDEFVSL